MNKEYYMAEFDGIKSSEHGARALAHYLKYMYAEDIQAINWWGSMLLGGQIIETNNTGKGIVPEDRKRGRI
jgi:hypothetical protein